MATTIKPDHQLPEAPASATLTVKTKNGYPMLFTIRDEKVFELIKKVLLVEAEFAKHGWVAGESRGGGFPARPQSPTKPCPFPGHTGAPMTEKTMKDGTKLWSHKKGAYPNFEYCNGQGYPSERVYQGSEHTPERQVDNDEIQIDTDF